MKKITPKTTSPKPKSDTEEVIIDRGNFSKIEVNMAKPVQSKKKNLKKWLVIGGIFLGLILIVLFTGVMPLLNTKAKADILAAEGRVLADALKNQDLEGAKNQLPKVKDSMAQVRSAYSKAYLLKLPVLNNYYSDGERMMNIGGYGLDALELSITTIEPYADLLGLKSGSSFVAGSADERIQTAVAALDKVTPKIGEIAQIIEKINSEMNGINPNRYPEKFGGYEVRSNIANGKKMVEDTSRLFLDAQPLLEQLPSILGQPDPKRYFVLFQNDKELRPTGGFLTAYAIFKIEQGKMLVESSEDIYELDNRISPKKSAPEEILTYHKGVFTFNIRDSNLSPDFKLSMQQFEELYPGEFDFDGIIAVDTNVLVEAIKILGEFNIAGRKFSAENDERCDCPRVIYELEDYATRPVNYVRETRKDIIGALMLEIMKKALGVSPSQYWGPLFQMGLDQINQKHMLAYMKEEKAQIGVESLNMGGRIADGIEILDYKDDSGWDYLHINDANMAGAKSNLFVEQTVTQDFSVKDGKITKTLTIDYKNPAPASDCNLETGGLCLNGILRNWVRIYVPKGSKLVEGKGSESPKDGSSNEFITREELGKTVFEGFLTVRPQGAAKMELKYELPDNIRVKDLTQLIQKQPGTAGPEYVIKTNGETADKFDLIADKVLKLTL